jgi:CHASE2 domain-containing sensor protein
VAFVRDTHRVTEPEPAAAATSEETSKSERRFAWIVTGMGVVALAVALYVALVHGVWLPLAIIAVGDIFTARTVIKAFRNAKRLEAEGR